MHLSRLFGSRSASLTARSCISAAVHQGFHLLPQSNRMSTKRGPLDLYFTRLPENNNKKRKVDVVAQAPGKSAISQQSDPKEPSKAATSNTAPWDQFEISASKSGPDHKQSHGIIPDAADPTTGNTEAACNKAADVSTAPHNADSASGAAGSASSVAVSAAAAVPAGPGPGAAEGAAEGAFAALMSATRSNTQPKRSAAGRKQLSTHEIRELASRNQAATQAAATAAATAGKQPQLKSLLVEHSWLEVLGPEFDKPYMVQLQSFVEKEWAAYTIYPPKESIFRAFNTVPFDQVRVVILGQDPYINPGEAMGLSFSVPPGVKIPPSLLNMYKELESDLGCTRPNHGCLEKWCHQGVLLLNASLTVRAKASNSHAGKGWESLTSAALHALASKRRGIVFLLWGKYAQDRCAKVDMKKHHVLKSVHPSPLSAHKGFLGCKHFSTANKLLQQSGLPPIDWQIDAI